MIYDFSCSYRHGYRNSSIASRYCDNFSCIIGIVVVVVIAVPSATYTYIYSYSYSHSYRGSCKNKYNSCYKLVQVFALALVLVVVTVAVICNCSLYSCS